MPTRCHRWHRCRGPGKCPASARQLPRPAHPPAQQGATSGGRRFDVLTPRPVNVGPVFDRFLLPLVKPALHGVATGLVRLGIGADAITVAGFGIGVAGSVAIAFGQFGVGLALILASRLADGLDGAVARLTQPTDRGAFLDITLDFLFYASVPLAFAVADPPANALPAALLLASFVGTGASFLAFAVLAERRGLASTALPDKGFFYLGGLTEGTETLICFVAMCLWPAHFAGFAYGFSALCAVTTLTRIAGGARVLGGAA
jgi:phosphatidylglycerophosphate synthase